MPHDFIALVDDEDYDLVSQYSWRALKKSARSLTRYAVYAPGSRRAAHRPRHNLYMHRLVLGLEPGDRSVDHVNGNGLDNRKSNLRFATQRQNMANQPKRPGRAGRLFTSRYKGVSLDSKGPKGRPWKAQIRSDGHPKWIGNFSTEEDAARAYDAKAKVLFGEFAWINFR